MSSKVTLKHIADALGYSTMTVSRAINDRSNVDEKTKKLIQDKAEEMGYTPNHVAKSLVSKKTYTIGVSIPEIAHAFFPEVARGIEEVTNRHDYQLFLTNADEKFQREKKSVKALCSKRVDGLLISSSLTTKDFSFYEGIIKNGPKVVFFDRCIDGLGVSCVRVNDRVSAREVTEHLIAEHAYTKIAHLSGPLNLSIGQSRFLGYKDALQQYNLAINKKWIVEAGFQENKGYEAMKKLLALSSGDRPRAVVAVNDPCAIGAIHAIEEEGLSIPDDIAITGFTDDIRAPLLDVPLTTIHQPAYPLGKRAAQKLIRTIENDEEPVENIEIATSLKIRASCGCENTSS